LSGGQELWTCELEKCDSPQEWTKLTDARKTESPCWSPDGQWIAFNASIDVHMATHVVREDGSDLRRVTESRADSPSWSHDGNWIYYYTKKDGIFKIPIEDGEPMGEPIHLVAEGINPVESPDTRFLYFWRRTGDYVLGASNDAGALHKVSVEGGQDVQVVVDVLSGGWDVAETGIYYFSTRNEQFEFYDLETGRITQLGRPTNPIRRGYPDRGISVAAEEDWLVYESAEVPLDVMLVKNFR
jgi:Tol biopolymer transport system component